MSNPRPPNEIESINALSCDAGSVASLMATIEVIDEIMKRTQKELELPEPPKPAKHFRLMVGAGFSGLLVILLGRLGLSVEEAKKHCITIMNVAFSEKKLLGKEAFKATRLKSAMEGTLKACGLKPDARMVDDQANEPEGCKVMVCVAPEIGMRAGVSVRFRNYTVAANSLPDCTIVEAVCATFAVPGLFKSAEVVELGGIKSMYIGLACFNPTVELLEEAANVFPNGHMGCVVSVGAEQNDASIESERVAREVSGRFKHRPGVYFRFYVGQGMGSIATIDWGKRSAGTKYAQAYLRLLENSTTVTALAETLAKGSANVPMDYLSGAVPAARSRYTAKRCPPPSPIFVGRGSQLDDMERFMASEVSQRRIYVLHGLGGVGKTQLALKFVELHGNKYQHVFYVDCTSTSTINTDLGSIARANGVGDSASDTLAWLAAIDEKWLIIFNNADDTSVNLRGYFPACSHGSIIVTTRNRGMANLANSMDAVRHVTKMTEDEAQELLEKATGSMHYDSDAAAKLAQTINYFPLAIVQAGAYIRTHMCSVDEYLEMYLKSQGQILEEYANETQKMDDYELTVYATWRISYERLVPLARRLFDVLAFMHHDYITEDIFRLATFGLQGEPNPLPLTAEEAKAEQMMVELLKSFTTLADGAWDKSAFLRTVHNLTSYSLLAYDANNRSYSIHPLVQQWARTVSVVPLETRICAALLLATSVMEEKETKEDMDFRRMLWVHVDGLPDDERLRPRIAGRFWAIYLENGTPRDQEQLASAENETNIRLLGPRHARTLLSKLRLSLAYARQGRLRDAEPLQREVLKFGRRVWGNEHPDTLTAMSCLAETCIAHGRWKEAESLFREVVEVGKRIRSDEHVRSLRAASNLGSIYVLQRRWAEAEEIQQGVLEVARRVCGNGHPDVLGNMKRLAIIYGSQGKWKEAEAIEREALDATKRLWGHKHPFTVMAIGQLAEVYAQQWRWAEAEALQREAVEIGKQTRGGEHDSTLTAMQALARTYLKQKRLEEAEALQREVVEGHRRTFGSEHPATLMAIGGLAKIYSAQQRWADAEKLQQGVVEAGSRIWGVDSPESLTSATFLAETYIGQGRLAEAETLQLRVFNAAKRVPGKEHPFTLMCMSVLAKVYFNQGQWKKAKSLQQAVADGTRQIWGNEHPETLSIMHSLAMTCVRLCQLRQAESLMSSVVDVRARTLGDSDADTIESIQALEAIQRELKEHPEKDYSMNIFIFIFSIILVLISWLLYRVLNR